MPPSSFWLAGWIGWTFGWAAGWLAGVCQNEAAAPCGLRHEDFKSLNGAPHGATKRVRGVPKWGGAAMRTAPLGP
eukprot:9486075-Pyramimonas_sp.AAC.1